jgi:hypothetical protein
MFWFATDGKLYLSYATHHPNLQAKGAYMACLNATTGQTIYNCSWFNSWWGGDAVIGDGIIAGLNAGYDNRIYAFGKGASQTTVQATPKISVNGDKVMVEGLVTDVAPGTSKYDVAARFPQGVPAVSDASQTDWMQYVYMQYPRPTNATGVDVSINVIDPNGNTYKVASATSDANGYYSCTFTPQVSGQYKIIANFDGTKSYYGSAAEASIEVNDSPTQATPTPIAENTSLIETYFIPAVAAIIIAIALVGAVIVLMLRKKA